MSCFHVESVNKQQTFQVQLMLQTSFTNKLNYWIQQMHRIYEKCPCLLYE